MRRKLIFGVFVIVVLVIIYNVVTYQAERSWNYMRGYESKVIGTICEMVKPEYLIDPSKC